MTVKLPLWAQATAFAVVTVAAYLVGVIPAEGGFDDVSVVQWLGGVVFLGAAFGIGSLRPADPSVVARLDSSDNYRAGEASALPTGRIVAEEATLQRLVEPKTYE